MVTNNGGGRGLQTGAGGGGDVKCYPYEKGGGGGAEKSCSHAEEEGTKSLLQFLRSSLKS